MSTDSVLVVGGAGISVESGIQPFRGKNGIWEENPLEMATFRKYSSDPAAFLSWYYHRFKSCLLAVPNTTHEILSSKGIRLITQNIDALHRKANHDPDLMIEIHGCLLEKRKVSAEHRSQIISAAWEEVNENDLRSSLFSLFQIPSSGIIDQKRSFRPHVLLFDEYYTELYQIEKAMRWVMEAETIIFMGTSNSVGITAGILGMSLEKSKQILVVDPNPSTSFIQNGVKIFKQNASEFCKDFF